MSRGSVVTSRQVFCHSGRSTWADFLRSQADALLACDFLETVTLSGARLHVFAVIEVVLSGIRMPRMNAIMERWVQTCRRELLDRTLIWDQHHLLHALREFEEHYNSHRPHQGIANTCPLQPPPTPDPGPGQINHRDIRRRERLGGILHEYQHAA